jgi:FG-GAP repeat
VRWHGRSIGIALAALAVLAPVVAADDVQLTSATRLTVTGAANDFGFFSGPAGDVNGDGRPDFLVTAYQQTVNGRTAAGEAWVVFGLPGRTSFNIADLGTDGFRIVGAVANGHLGESAIGLGDVNGDGKSDVLVSAPDVNSSKGVAYVVFGKADSADVDLATFNGTQTGGYRILGAATQARLGYGAAAKLGDVDGDGRADAILGASFYNDGSAVTGAAYVVFSHASTADVDLAGAGWGYLIKGAAQSDVAGGSVAGPGDVNGDGIPDAVVGAHQHSLSQARAQNGAAYVVFGKHTGTAVDLSALGSGGIEIDGAASIDQLGYFVGPAGDNDHDGKADIAVSGIFTDHHGRTDSGTIYVIRGRAAAGTIDLAAPPAGYGYAIDGALPSARLQRPDGSADLDHDGLNDLAIVDVAKVGTTSHGQSQFPIWLLPGQAGNVDQDLASPPAGTRRLIVTNAAFEAHPLGGASPDLLVGQNGQVDVVAQAAAASPTPVATTTSPPPPPPPPPPIGLTPPAKLSASSIVVLPKASHCVSRTRMTIRLKLPKDIVVTSATVRVNGKRKALVRGTKLKRAIVLRHLPSHGFTLAVTLKASGNRSDKVSRRYRVCH